MVEDQERFSPSIYEAAVAEVVGEERAGRRILHVTYQNGLREECVVRMSRGWCLMQSATVVVALAAHSTATGTLLAHLEHWRLPGRTPFNASKLEGELLKIESLAIQGKTSA